MYVWLSWGPGHGQLDELTQLDSAVVQTGNGFWHQKPLELAFCVESVNTTYFGKMERKEQIDLCGSSV